MSSQGSGPGSEGPTPRGPCTRSPDLEQRGSQSLGQSLGRFSEASSEDSAVFVPRRTRGPAEVLGDAVRLVGETWTFWTLEGLDGFNNPGHKGRAFRGIIGLVFVCSGGVLVMLLQWCTNSLHVHFWLEDLPLVAIVCSMMAIGFLFGVLVQIRLVSLLRRRESRISADANQHGRKYKERDCSVRPAATKYLLYFTLLPALASGWMGFMMLKLGPAVAGEIAGENCGASGSSKNIAEAEQRLTAFYNECQRGAGAPGRDHPVTDCPNFADAFPPPSPLVGYIKAAERDFDCAGFCRAGARPFFDRSSSGAKERCSVAIGNRLLLASRAVGGLCVALGIGSAIVAVSLASLQDL